MMKFAALFFLLVMAGVALASPNASISERQTLLGVGDGRYYVMSVEREIRNSHVESYQRIFLKQYGLDDNQTLQEDLLSETIVASNSESPAESPETTSSASVNLDKLLSEQVVQFSGYAKRPIKKFHFDGAGVYVILGGSRDYVLTLVELIRRIPDYLGIMKYTFTRPSVTAIHSVSTSDGLRYFLVIRSGTWMSDVNNFERVISLPED